MKQVTAVLVLICTVCSFAYAEENTNTEAHLATDWTKSDKALVLNALGFTFIGTWGIINWDYGTYNSHITPDDWFGRDSIHGGADKIGHSYSTYATSHILSYSYESWGYSKKSSALYGTLSGLGMHLFVEFGDSFSSFGFSAEDMLMNTVGASVAYFLYRYPQIHRAIDYRVEYIPTFTRYDFFTDYEGLKYLVAFKLESIDALNKSFGKYLEIHGGFYARGYEGVYSEKTRNIYFAIGINVSELIRSKTNFKNSARLFNYLQVPYTYVDRAYKLGQ